MEPRRKTRAAYQKPEPLTQEELERLGFIKKQRCSVCTREYTEDNLPAVVSYRAVERLREGWSAQFGTEALKDARYAAATKLYVRTPLLSPPIVSLPSFLPKSADGPSWAVLTVESIELTDGLWCLCVLRRTKFVCACSASSISIRTWRSPSSREQRRRTGAATAAGSPCV